MTRTPRDLADGDTFTHRRLTFRVHITQDDSADPPWKHGDDHGIVSDWVPRDENAEDADGNLRILAQAGRQVRYYDWTASYAKALEEGWDAAPYGQGTPAEQATRAVDADYQYLKDWCEDRWTYIGVQVELLDTTCTPPSNTGYLSCGLCGIESNADEHIADVAREEADELILDAGDRIRATVGRLTALERQIETARRDQDRCAELLDGDPHIRCTAKVHHVGAHRDGQRSWA